MSKTQAKLVALEAEDQNPFSNADEFESIERDHDADNADLPDRAAPDRLLQFWRSGFLRLFCALH
jgi:hypothetical protein